MKLDRSPSPDSSLLRPVRADELGRIQEIERASFSSPWPRSAFELAVRTPRIVFQGAERGHELVGYVVAVRDEDGVLIANLAVHPDARRHGVGSDLLAEAVDWAQALRAPCCHLEVRVSNAAAIGLYRRHGFRGVGIESGYYRDPAEDALSMELRLQRWTP